MINEPEMVPGIKAVAITLSQWRNGCDLGEPQWDKLRDAEKSAYYDQAEAAIVTMALLPKTTENKNTSGWYINQNGKKIELCSASDAIMFGLEYFSEDVFEFYNYMLEWSHGTIEEVQENFDEWKKSH